MKYVSLPMMLATCILLTSFAPAALAQAGNGFVGVYSDAKGTMPCTYVPQGSGTTLYVIATISGQTADGITGAEFRIEVENPSGWSFSYTAPSGALTLGDPMDLDPDDPDDGSGLAGCGKTVSGRLDFPLRG